MLADDDLSELDAVKSVRQLDIDAQLLIGHAAAQLSCVIEANFPGLDRDRIENSAIEFAYKLFMAQRQH